MQGIRDAVAAIARSLSRRSAVRSVGRHRFSGFLPALFIILVPFVATGSALAGPPGHQPTGKPRQLLNMLFLDLAGLSGPDIRSPPIWRRYLSQRTEALQQELAALDAEDRWDALRLDWLCQCYDRKHIKIPPLILAEDRTRAGVTLTVKVLLQAGESHTLMIALVDQDGWKIDEIVDERGRRFTGALEGAIRDHHLRRKPLS